MIFLVLFSIKKFIERMKYLVYFWKKVNNTSGPAIPIGDGLMFERDGFGVNLAVS